MSSSTKLSKASRPSTSTPSNSKTVNSKSSTTSRNIVEATLILDLDNTLVHTLDSKEYAKLKSKIKVSPDLTLKFKKTATDDEDTWYIFFRPYLFDFIDKACEFFDNIIVWSAGTQDYVEPVSKVIFKMCGKKLRHIFYRESFDTVTKDIENLLAKDPKISKSHIYFFDDIPRRILNLENSQIIVVPEFRVDKCQNDNYFENIRFSKTKQ